MADLVFLAVIVAFFAVCVLYVDACDRIIGAGTGASTVTSSAGDSNTASTSGEPLAPSDSRSADVPVEVPA